MREQLSVIEVRGRVNATAMALSEDNDPHRDNRDSLRDADVDDDAELQERLSRVSIPPVPTVPPPPDIQFQRPSAERSKAVRQTAQNEIKTTYKIGSDRPAGSPPSVSQSAQTLGSGLGAGITFAASIIVGFLLGQWVDRKFGFANGGVPWGTMVLSLLGIGAGFINLFRLLSITDRRKR